MLNSTTQNPADTGLSGAQKTQRALKALEMARHELTTLHGLIAADGMAPQETFPIDTSAVVAALDEAIGETIGAGNQQAQMAALQAAYAEYLAEIMRALMRSSGEVHREWREALEQLDQRFLEVFAVIAHQNAAARPPSSPA